MPIYCPPKEFKAAIEQSIKDDKLTDEALKYLFAIAKESSKKLKYQNPRDREDCIMTAMEDVLKYWRNYDPKKSNYPFAYYTQMIKNGFAKGWNELHPIKVSQKISLSNENMHSI